MKRRQRTNSMEADLLELNVIHSSIRDNRAEAAALASSESHARYHIHDVEASSRSRLLAEFEKRRTDIVISRSRTETASQPPPIVAMMGELFIKSRRKEQEESAARAAERLGAKQKAIAKYKEQLMEKLREARQGRIQSESQRRDALDEERHRRMASLTYAGSSLSNQRSFVASEMRAAASRNRQELQRLEEERVMRNQARVMAQRKDSLSPSQFLKLPPLFAANASDASDAKMLRMLRREEALRSALRNNSALATDVVE